MTTASTSKACRRPTWCWSACRARRRRRPRSISPIAASRPATCRWCRACRWRREVEKLTRPLVVGLYASPERIVQIRENRLLGSEGASRRRSLYRQDGGGRGGGVFAPALRQVQLAVDRRDAPLDRGNRRRGDEAVERAPPPAGDVIPRRRRTQSRACGVLISLGLRKIVMPLWLSPQPLVLASKSDVRGKMLAAVGLRFEIRPAQIDERAVEARSRPARRGRRRPLAGARQGRRGGALAARPAGARRRPDAGARGKRFSKPASRAEAAEQLRGLARAHARAQFRAGAGARRRGAVRLRRQRAADHARFFRPLSRRLSRHGGRRRVGERRRLSARRHRHSSVRAGATATISPFSACRCCRCSLFCGENGFIDG